MNNPKVVKLDTVNEIGSVVILIAWRITIAIKLAVNKPNKTSAGIIKYRFAVNKIKKSKLGSGEIYFYNANEYCLAIGKILNNNLLGLLGNEKIFQKGKFPYKWNQI